MHVLSRNQAFSFIIIFCPEKPVIEKKKECNW